MADQDLKIRGRGGHPDPEGSGGRSQKMFFRPFGPHFGLSIREGPSTGSATAHDGGKLTRVGQLSLAERLQGRWGNPLARVTLTLR